MARDHVGPSHEHTPQSVLDAPTPHLELFYDSTTRVPYRRGAGAVQKPLKPGKALTGRISRLPYWLKPRRR